MLRISYVGTRWHFEIDGHDITEYVRSFEISGVWKTKHDPRVTLHLTKDIAIDLGDVDLEEIDVSSSSELPRSRTIVQSVPKRAA